MTMPTKSESNGMCPAPFTVTGFNGPVTFCCERSYDHPGDHLAAGRHWTIDRRTGQPAVTKLLTRKDI